MSEAPASSSGVYWTSTTFAVLVTSATAGRLTAITGAVTDAFGNRVTVRSSDVARPGSHSLLDPSYWAVRCNWEYLGAQGIRVENAIPQRTWEVEIEATIDDGSQESLTVRCVVST